jgi:putative membrane protein
MFGHDGWMWFGGGFMWLFWILLIVIVVWAVKAASSGGSSSSPREESPMEILKKRYARGEIDDEEFERRRKELED